MKCKCIEEAQKKRKLISIERLKKMTGEEAIDWAFGEAWDRGLLDKNKHKEKK